MHATDMIQTITWDAIDGITVAVQMQRDPITGEWRILQSQPHIDDINQTQVTLNDVEW